MSNKHIVKVLRFVTWFGDLLEQRLYKNDSTESRCMLILKSPPFFPHRIAEWKSAAISKQTFIWTPSSLSYIILSLVLTWVSASGALTKPTFWSAGKLVINNNFQLIFKRLPIKTKFPFRSHFSIHIHRY